MGYLGVNMSGASIPVYSTDISSNVKIGELYHRERFAVESDGPITRVIKFVNPTGNWVYGRIDLNARISDWSDYSFYCPYTNYYIFHSDGPVDLYNSAGQFIKTCPAGTKVVPYGRNQGVKTQNGDVNLDFMRIWALYDSSGNYIEGAGVGNFVDCKIRFNSMNTPVYGRGF